MKINFLGHGLLMAVLTAGEARADKLPEWYTANRIQFHWENYADDVDRKGGVDNWIKWLSSVHDVIEDSGAKVGVACGRGGAEGAWWPTSVGESYAVFGTRDILNDAVIGDYHRRGMKVIIYYRHDMDYAMEELHPEWLARNADGSPVVHNRAATIYGKNPLQMCQNSPFREFTKQRLVEIFSRGADGVYFDENHMPEVCFCGNCQRAFEKKFGRPMPVNPLPGTAEYLELARFVGKTMTDAFTEWKQAVHTLNPQGVLLVATSEYGSFEGIHHTEEMAMAGSANKSEFQKCFGGQQHSLNSSMQKLKTAHPEYWLPPRDLKECLEWMISRDVLAGLPPHVWVHRPDATVEGEVLHTAAAVVAHGAVAGMSIPALKQYVPVYEKLFAMNDALVPFMADARPYAGAVIHVSNELKEKLYVAGGVDPKAKYKLMFEDLYAPVLGAANTLSKAHIPFSTVSDTFIKEERFFPETKVMIVPSYDLLSAELKAAITASGLKVVKLAGDWHLEASQALLGTGLLSECGTFPVSIEGPGNLVSTLMINKKSGDLLVSLVRNWEWFWFWKELPGHIWAEERDKQLPIQNVTIRTTSGLSAEELWPALNEQSITENSPGVVTVPDVEIARFIKLSDSKASRNDVRN